MALTQMSCHKHIEFGGEIKQKLYSNFDVYVLFGQRSLCIGYTMSTNFCLNILFKHFSTKYLKILILFGVLVVKI